MSHEPFDSSLEEQARQIETCLPAIMRALFTLEGAHPANELPVAQLRICTLLRFGQLSMSALSKELGTSVSAVTQMADRLETGGFVERCADPDDRRSRCLRLTAYGTEVMSSRTETRVRRAATALKVFSSEERVELLRLLGTFLEAARPHCPQGPFPEIHRLQS